MANQITSLPPGFKATAAFLRAVKPVKRARVPGKAKEEVENIMGITPELFTCLRILVHSECTLQNEDDSFIEKRKN